MSKTTINDMTIGSPAKLIIKFMIPMCLGNLFQQFYNVVDSIVAGQFLGVQALAAIGSTGSLMFFVIGWLNGLTSGFAIMVAQSFGAKQYDRMRHYVAMSIYLSVAFALVMTIGFSVANEQILRLMNYSDEIMPSVKGYLGIIYMGLLVTVAYDALSAFLRALGDSRSPLYFLMISAGINVVLDIVLIVVMGMGVEGCAYATVIAQAISALLCFIYICKKFPILRLKKTDFQIALKSLGKLLALGIPMALQFSITAIGSIILQTAVNTLGTVSVTAVTAASKLQMILTGPMECLGITMATYCGQNRGAREFERIRSGIRTSVVVSMIYCVVSAVIIIVLGGWMALLFLDASETEVMAQVKEYLRLNAYFYPTLGLLFILRNGLQGMSYSFLPMMSGVTELIARVLVCVAFVPDFGYTAACMASPVAWIFADTLLVTVYFVKMKSLKVQLAQPAPAAC